MGKHTKVETEKMILFAAQEPETFYRADCVNYKGTTFKAEGNEFYTEIISEWLLMHPEILRKIPCITRDDSYWIKSHDGHTRADASNRMEERIAMEVFRNGTVAPLGRVLDYQTPLKNKESDDAGKIDLLSYDDDAGILRILELKKPKSGETLLRCVLEGYTYFMKADINKLLSDFEIPQCREIRICPLFFRDSNQYTEYEDLKNGKRPQLRALMTSLTTNNPRPVKIEPIMLEKTGIKLSADTEQYAAKILPY